jgi:hypothetical protein
MRKLAFLLLLASTLFAQGTKPQPLAVGGDKLNESITEYRGQHPNCFLPTESLPTNYKAYRYRDNVGVDRFDCQVTSGRQVHLHLLGFRVRKESTVISNGHVTAIFYDLRRKDFSAVERTFRKRLGGPTEEKPDGYIAHDGCKCKEIHWRNDVSDIVLVDECEHDKYEVAAVNLFYLHRDDLTTKPGQ